MRAIRPTPVISPTIAPTIRGEAFGRLVELPGQRARRHHHLAQRVAGGDDADKPTRTATQRGLRRLRQRRVDLGGEVAGEPGLVVDVVGVDGARDEPGDADEEQQQRDEEEEQAEGDRAARRRSR